MLTPLNLIREVYAQETNVEDTTIDELVGKFIDQVLNPLVIILFGIALVVFLWGLTIYVVGSQGEPKRIEQARRVIPWAIAGMFLMASVWGIIKVLCNFFETCLGIKFP